MGTNADKKGPAMAQNTQYFDNVSIDVYVHVNFIYTFSTHTHVSRALCIQIK